MQLGPGLVSWPSFSAFELQYFIPKHSDLEGWAQEGWRFLLRPWPSAAAPKARSLPAAAGVGRLVLQAPGPAEN